MKYTHEENEQNPYVVAIIQISFNKKIQVFFIFILLLINSVKEFLKIYM